MPTPKSFALWRILHDLFQVPFGVCFQWFVPERSPLYPWSWTRHRRNGVRFPKYPHGCSSRLRYSGPTFHFWTRWLVSWLVELGLTGPTSFQQTSARLVPSPLRCLFPMIRPWAFALVSWSWTRKSRGSSLSCFVRTVILTAYVKTANRLRL